MFTKKYIFINILMLVSIYFLAGCATYRPYVHFEEGAKLNKQTAFFIAPVINESNTESQKDPCSMFISVIKGNLEKNGFTVVEKENTNVVKIQCRLIEYDPGSKTLRYFVGFGAGTGICTMYAEIINEKKTIGEIRTTRKLAGGLFGGSKTDLIFAVSNDISKEIIKIAKDMDAN